MANRYSKALKHLKNKNIDEKLKLLEQLPTNHTGGLYLDIPGETIIPPPEQLLPRAADFTEDGQGQEGYTGNDTTGLFLSDGTILTVEPPGDTSYILGPMSSMWYAWANYTQIGYIRQSDRKMVNLGRITGELDNWDGETGFTGYGQMSIEQVRWFKEEYRLTDYRAFYPGPPSSTPDEYGRYICTITGTPKPTTSQPPPYKDDDTMRGPDPNDVLSLLINKKRRSGAGGPGAGGPGAGGPGGEGGEGGPGAGGPGGEGGEGGPGDGPPPPDDIIDPNTGEPRENATPEELAKAGQYAQQLAQKAMAGTLTPAEQKTFDSYSGENSIFKSIIDNESQRIETLKNKAPGTHTPAEQQTLLNAGLDDFVQGGMKSTDIFGDLATLAGAAAVVKGGMAVAGNAVVQGIVGFAKHTVGTLGTVKTAELISDVVTDKLPGVIGDAKNSGDYNTQLAVKLPISILTGQPQEIKLSDSAKIDQINNVTNIQFEKALQIKPVQKPSAETTVNPTPGLKKPLLDKESGWGAQGGSEVNYDPKTDTLTITSEKMLRTGQEGDKFDGDKQTRFGDIPDAKPEVVAKLTRDILNIPGTKEIPAILGSPEYQKILKDPAYLESEVIPRVSKMANDATAGVIQGTASNVVDLRKTLTDTGLLPQSEVEKTGGGYGQVYSQTSYKGNEIPSNLRAIITKKTGGVKESVQPKFLRDRNRKQLTEIRTPKQKRIIRDIKKPVQVKEIPTKFKVKPTGRKNKSVGVDMMKIPDVPKQYKPQMNIWGKADYNANVRASQEKKNEVLELVGAAEHHWTYLTEDRRKKQQEKVNEMMSVEYDKQMELLYEKHRIKESKITKAMSAFRKPTDIAPEYPKEPPPQLDPQTGMHPKFGKNYKHDKLDPQSAESMPSTGNPEIDANVKKATNAKEKARKLKILLGKRA